MFKKLTTCVAFALWGISIYSQQLPLYSQYMLNGFQLNSAMAGYDGYTAFNLTSRQQWVGITNAPQTFSLTAQTRVLFRSYIIKARPLKGNKFIAARTGRVGLGFNVFSDRNGYFSQTGGSLSYAYHIPFPNAQLSFGVSGIITQFRVNPAGIAFRDANETKGIAIGEPSYAPDASAGVFYVNRQFYGGLSATNLLQSYIKFGGKSLQGYRLKRHYFLMVGYRYNYNTQLVYEPTVLVKTTESLLVQVDLSMKAIFQDSYMFGLSYRTGNAIIFNLGFKKGKYYISYSYDYDFSAFQNSTYGSHELNLGLKFGDSAKRYKWLRRF
jgi:type IX secretion system PorP/SprF family membrane protein